MNICDQDTDGMKGGYREQKPQTKDRGENCLNGFYHFSAEEAAMS